MCTAVKTACPPFLLELPEIQGTHLVSLFGAQNNESQGSATHQLDLSIPRVTTGDPFLHRLFQPSESCKVSCLKEKGGFLREHGVFVINTGGSGWDWGRLTWFTENSLPSRKCLLGSLLGEGELEPNKDFDKEQYVRYIWSQISVRRQLHLGVPGQIPSLPGGRARTTCNLHPHGCRGSCWIRVSLGSSWGLAP